MTVTDPFGVASDQLDGDPDRAAGLISGGRYRLPHPTTGKPTSYTRVTTFARTLANSYLLDRHAGRDVLRGLVARPDYYELAQAVDPAGDDAKSQYDTIADAAQVAAGSDIKANRGTTLHGWCTRVDRLPFWSGLPVPEVLRVPEGYLDDIIAYRNLLELANLDIINTMIERVVMCSALGVVGRFDRLVLDLAEVTVVQNEELIPNHRPPSPGIMPIVDLKGGATLDYSRHEVAIQLACYAHADLIFDEQRGTWSPMSEGVNRRVAYVVHVPVGSGRAELFEVDIVAGWESAQRVLAERRYARSEVLTSRLTCG